MEYVRNSTYDEERAFYGKENICAVGCRFDGPRDGESAFKECRSIVARECYFNLRYPFWHDCGVVIEDSVMTEGCRAALWYSTDIKIVGCELNGVKALRECSGVYISDSAIKSQEFGWMSRGVSIEDCRSEGEYFMFRGRDMKLRRVEFKGKYSFQYVENAELEGCSLDTKDALWHAKNVTVRNCTVKGEYLGWYCENVTFENCLIIGTQPLCYCKGLRLINCRMRDADLSFEKSEVFAELDEPIISIKNPSSGKISVPSVGDLIVDDPDSRCEIIAGSESLINAN